jgi:hypothetical protein
LSHPPQSRDHPTADRAAVNCRCPGLCPCYMAMPYFIFLGLSITLLPSPFVKIAFRCVLLAWAIVASATFLAVTDKMFHWEAIAKEIAVTAHPCGGSAICSGSVGAAAQIWLTGESRVDSRMGWIAMRSNGFPETN